jgi:hypothetical protein
MKIAAVSMVKNESDIIELFIKINSRFFDAIYILDHQSTDSTSEIIKSMKKLGYNVYYAFVNDRIYNQSRITSNAVNQIASLNLYDFIMPIDADEFIPDNDFELIKEFLKKNKSNFDLGFIPWKTYCPINIRYFEADAPLYENFVPRIAEVNQFYKIIISNELSKKCTIAMGNHDLSDFSKKINFQKHIIPSHLIHAPIRSQEQIISKAILGSYSFKLKKDRAPGEGFHWDQIATKIREMNYSLTDQILFQIAENYALPKNMWTSNNLNERNNILNQSRIGRSDDKIQFKELAIINILKNFDSRIAELIDNLTNNSN